ncbi:MAG: CDP-glucose 4,6-dehydratase [Sorangiineae bacterium]|nr:CDP-glucose 4,6-dehydratase [Polyangiaceae bacterium]MEB2324095.1 CDP-glucose 4,6-dehydratase [Sorangiineae bacterium]
MNQASAGFYAGKSVLVTGHTGFKGAWLARWLQRLGARVTGFALAPETTPSLFSLARLAETMTSVTGDVRDRRAVEEVVSEAAPELVFHLAAQALVRRSYREPVETYATNVMGTAHLLEACRHASSVRAIVIVTSDKCYENREWEWGYREDEAMGGADPYSSSKGAAELVTAAYRRSFFHEPGAAGLASARAGNVIGGGDWSEDRLFPDLVRGATEQRPITIRNPAATRPWQHVLEPLSGYLLLAEQLFAHRDRFGKAYNFGPTSEDTRAVGAVAERFVAALGQGELSLAPPDPSAPHEAGRLTLDSSRARAELGWRPRLGLDAAVELTAAWYREHLRAPGHERTLMDQQIDDYASRRP